jgi:hypothetical protein
MSRRRRNLTIVLAIIAALVGAEVVLNLLKGPQVLVELENVTADRIENLVFNCGSVQTIIPGVEPGETIRVYLSGRGPATLQLRFDQNGRAREGLTVQGFDPGTMSRDGLKLVMRVRRDGIDQFSHPGEPSTLVGRLWNQYRYEAQFWLEQFSFYRRLR